MLNLKKTAVAVLALGSSAVFAGTMGPVCAPGNVTVPCEKTAWNVGAQALYLQPVYSLEGNYPQAALYPSTATSNLNANYQTATTPYQWGFMVEGSYHFGMGNDVNVNWYRVHNTTDVANPTFDFTDPGAAPAHVFSSQSATANPQWDQVDVELGQHVDFGDMKSVRLHGGVEYARITTQYNTATVIPTSISLNETANSSYNGFGPRGGVDAKYQLGNGFSVYGKGAGSLLVGPSSFSNSIVSSTTTNNASAFGSSTLIVPELEGKLGVNYDYAMAQGDLTLDIGWMWINYFNAQQNALNGSFANNGTTTNGPVRGFKSSTDFGLQGLYFGGKWTGNV